MKSRILVLALIVVCGSVAAYLALDRLGQTPPADLVLRGGRIVTLDEQRPEAEAIAIRDGRILAVGSKADIAGYLAPSTQILELGGQFAMPGFIEGHGHFTGIGESGLILDLLTTTSWDQIVRWWRTP